MNLNKNILKCKPLLCLGGALLKIFTHICLTLPPLSQQACGDVAYKLHYAQREVKACDTRIYIDTLTMLRHGQ